MGLFGNKKKKKKSSDIDSDKLVATPRHSETDEEVLLNSMSNLERRRYLESKETISWDERLYKHGILSPFEFWTQIWERKVANGAYDKDESNGRDEFYIGYRKVFAQHQEKVFYAIEDFPEEVPREIFKLIRRKVENYGVVVDFVMRVKPHIIDWSNPQMKEKRRMAEEYTTKMSKYSINDFSTTSERKKLRDTARTHKTFGYFGSIEDRDRMLCKADWTIEVVRTLHNEIATANFKEAQKRLKNYLYRLGFEFKEVKGNLYEYYETRSPVSGNFNKRTTIETDCILSDEIVARFPGYFGGKIGNSQVLLGRDITNNMLIYKALINSNGGAENFLVVAETGGGKSFMVKGITEMILGFGLYVVVLDVDGEYVPQCTENNGVIIDMEDCYYDTMEISEPTGDWKLDKGLMKESRQATASVFATLTDLEKGFTPDERTIFTAAYNRLYDEKGILPEDMSTWPRTKDLCYLDLYNSICALDTAEDAREVGVDQKVIKEFISKLSPFFKKGGLYAHMFVNKVSVNKVFERTSLAPVMVDIVLNLQKNATSGEELIEQTVKQLTASYLSTMITNRVKQMGRFSVEIIEEYQRYSQNERSADMVLTHVTGNRKRNSNCFLITNSPLALLNSGTASAFAVVENINNFIVGALKPRTIDAVCEVFNLDNCEDTLREISGNYKFKHTFLYKLNNREVTVGKFEVPPDLVKSKIFMTRDTVQRLEKGENLTWEQIQAIQEAKFNAKSDVNINYSEIRDEVLRKKEEGKKIAAEAARR